MGIERRQRVLRGIRQRFPPSKAASEAAFFLPLYDRRHRSIPGGPVRIKAFPLLLVLLLCLIPALAAAAPIPVSGLVLGPGSGPGGGSAGLPVAGARVLLIPTLGFSEAARLELEGKAD